MDVDDAAVSLASQIIRFCECCERKLPDGRIAPYRDARGIPTIGWGNTRWRDGRAVSMDDAPISQADADVLYNHFLGVFAKGVCELLPNGTSANETAAFISLSYNIGLRAFSHSAALRRFLVGNKRMAGRAIEMWNKCDGVVLKGLRRRRRAERLVFDGIAVNAALRQAELAFP
jgi:lysozyme